MVGRVVLNITGFTFSQTVNVKHDKSKFIWDQNKLPSQKRVLQLVCMPETYIFNGIVISIGKLVHWLEKRLK